MKARRVKCGGKEPSPIRYLNLYLGLWMALCSLAAWAVVSPEQVAYDRYFDAATFALETQARGDSVAYWLVMTYDEGHIVVPQGSELVLRLRDRSVITLTTDREINRGDVLLRRWRDHTAYYVRCHYPVTRAQLARMLDKDVYRLEISTARGPIVRNVRRFKQRLAVAYSALSE